jgi:hypothetical protein
VMQVRGPVQKRHPGREVHKAHSVGPAQGFAADAEAGVLAVAVAVATGGVEDGGDVGGGSGAEGGGGRCVHASGTTRPSHTASERAPMVLRPLIPFQAFTTLAERLGCRACDR